MKYCMQKIHALFRLIISISPSVNVVITLLIIILICTDGILLSVILPLTNTLQEAIIATIVGGGVIAGIVSILILDLQDKSIYVVQQSQSEKFFTIKLVPDLNEIFDRDKSIWSLGGGHKFYFDNSFANSLFDVFEQNFDKITSYQTYFPKSELIQTYVDFYRKIRHGYVMGEKIDTQIQLIIRNEHHARNIMAFNDIDAF